MKRYLDYTGIGIQPDDWLSKRAQSQYGKPEPENVAEAWGGSKIASLYLTRNV